MIIAILLLIFVAVLFPGVIRFLLLLLLLAMIYGIGHS